MLSRCTHLFFFLLFEGCHCCNKGRCTQPSLIALCQLLQNVSLSNTLVTWKLFTINDFQFSTATAIDMRVSVDVNKWFPSYPDTLLLTGKENGKVRAPVVVLVVPLAGGIQRECLCFVSLV